ncbi:MAG: DNA repair protein RadA [Armatimonadota bacterium]
MVSVDECSLRLNPASVTAFHSQGHRSIVRLTTGLGRQLRCTAGHQVLTQYGWRSVCDLKPGDRVAGPRCLSYFGREPMPETAIKLIAYVISEGSTRKPIDVTTGLPEVVTDLEEIAAAFGSRLVRYAKPNGGAASYRFVTSWERRRCARAELATLIRHVQRRKVISWAEWARRAQVSYEMVHAWKRGSSTPSEKELERLAEAVECPLADLAPHLRHQAERVSPVARFLERHGLLRCRAADKAIPLCIFRLPRAQLAIFLRTLFTGDGSVYVTQQGRVGLSYSTISRRLAEDVQHLLLRFGVITKLRTKHARVAGADYVSYELSAHGATRTQAFVSEIGILGRARALAKVATHRPSRGSTRTDTVPTGEPFWNLLEQATGGISFRDISARAGVFVRKRRRERPLQRATITRLAEAYPHPRLRALGCGDIYWDEVVAVEPDGEAEVYDLSVSRTPNFVANDLVVHNSTLALQAANQLSAAGHAVLYVTGEESPQQTKMRAERIAAISQWTYLLAETDLDGILGAARKLRPVAMIVDSIQTMHRSDVSSSPGSVAQVRECTAALVRLAKDEGIATFIVGHVTKEGAIAGPRVLEHLVDTVLYFEGDRHHAYRILRATKNRFGSTNEIGVFEMAGSGLVEVPNPSAAFLSERPQAAAGSVVVCAIEGTRPLLVEVQALVSPTHFGMPRRTAAGVDYNRVLLLLAVLERRAGLQLAAQDVYVSVAGGLVVEEPAADLGIAVAVASSLRDRPVDPRTVVIGEVGLTGEVRTVPQLGKRLGEAARLGFARAVIPRAAGVEGPEGQELDQVPDLSSALRAIA